MSTFSIITVTRDNLKGLKETHDSIRAQSCRDFEWIAVDGASTDGSAAYLRDSGARFVSEPDGGIYDAMNKGLGIARGVYVIFMNAGDRFAAPDVLQKTAAAIAAQPHEPGFIYGDALEERPGGVPARKPARDGRRISAGMPTHHQAMFYARAWIGGLRFDTRYEIAADYKFTAQILMNGAQTAPLRLDFPVCLFAAGGVSQRRVVKGRNEQFRIRKELGLCGAAENIRIYAAQTAVMALRRAAPGLYWRLRQSCGNSASGRAPAQTPLSRPETRA